MTLLAEGRLEAMRGRFDDGRARYREGREILVEMGAAIRAAGTRSFAGDIERLAGDLPAAEREFRRCVEELSALGELGFLSTHAANLGQILYEQGRFHDAEEMSKLSEASAASDDFISQAQWRGLRAKVLARGGVDREARAMIDEAIAILEGSDMFDLQWETRRDLAEVHRLAGRSEEASRALREALALLEVKGVTPLIERVSPQLRALEAPIAD
jgi:tetratricopeptide (TPR) repeat protein